MFESDDFDQVLSQFEFSTSPDNIRECENNTKDRQPNSFKPTVIEPDEPVPKKSKFVIKSPMVSTSSKKSLNLTSTEPNSSHTIPMEKATLHHKPSHKSPSSLMIDTSNESRSFNFHTINNSPIVSPKLNKKKMINSFFDMNSKRKFPGPAGLLNGSLEESKDDICQMELLSQDIDFSQNILKKDVFVSPLWNRLLCDIRSWGLGDIDSITSVKTRALAGNLRRQKAHLVTAFIEAIDRSSSDPLVILRDISGSIQCTLHRDAWTAFSSYLVSEYCALVLLRPTVLTTGGAYKKHYLNITISNIYAIYSSAVLIEDEENKVFPDGYSKVYEKEFTVIKTDGFSESNSGPQERRPDEAARSGNEDLLEGLDGSIFLDEIF